MEWKNLSNNQTIDLISYVKQTLKKKPDTEIWIGCDSQVFRHITKYIVCVCLHTKRGGNLIYSKFSTQKQDQFSRLMKEVESTISVGEEVAKGLFLKRDSSGKYPFLQLHMDLSPDKKYASNKVFLATIGWSESLGFDTYYKPFAPAASKASDMLVKS